MLMMELIAIYSFSLLLRNMQRCTSAAGGRRCHCLQRPSPAGCQRASGRESRGGAANPVRKVELYGRRSFLARRALVEAERRIRGYGILFRIYDSVHSFDVLSIRLFSIDAEPAPIEESILVMNVPQHNSINNNDNDVLRKQSITFGLRHSQLLFLPQ